jgi:hypothetical protein
MLAKLRSLGKTTFLVSNFHFEFLSVMMEASLGSQWKQLFDFIVVESRQPLFVSASAPFQSWN